MSIPSMPPAGTSERPISARRPLEDAIRCAVTIRASCGPQRLTVAFVHARRDAMLLVILGAGASADSALPDAAIPTQAQGWMPPLADELFAPRFHATLVKRCGAVVLAERVRTGVARGESLEQVLARLQADTSDPLRAGQLLELQSYLQELLWNCGAHWNTADAGMSNYLTLVTELEEWRGKASQKIFYTHFTQDTPPQ